MIVSVPFAFQVRSLQGLVKLETELARRAQVKQLKSEKLSPCSRGNLEDSNACASPYNGAVSATVNQQGLTSLNAKDRQRINSLTEINDFLQNRQLGARSISL